MKFKINTKACVLQHLAHQISFMHLPTPICVPFFLLLKHAKLRIYALAIPTTLKILSHPLALNSNVSPSR